MDWELEDMSPANALTVAQIAKLLGVHPVTVQRWLRTGQLKGRQISRKSGWRVRPEDLRAFINTRTPAQSAS